VAGSITTTVNIQQPPRALDALHQIPSPPADFTGRAGEIETLLAAMRGGQGVAISGLHGIGGVGKTALAYVLAERLREAYPDAQFLVDMRGTSDPPTTPADALAQVIRAYHPAARLPERLDELQGLYRSLLADKRALILLDNARDAAQVAPLTPPASCALLITSRTHFTLPGLFDCDLDRLSRAESRALLEEITRPRGSPATPWVARPTRSDLDEIAALCADLPLALRVAGSAIAVRGDLSMADHLRRLRDASKRLALLPEVERVLQSSYELLPDEMQEKWRALGVFPADFDVPAAAAIWELSDEDAAQDALSELGTLSLVEWEREKTLKVSETFRVSVRTRYRLHDLARLYARKQQSAAERERLPYLHAAHYETVARAAQQLYLQGGARVLEGLSLFDREFVNIRAGQEWAAEGAAASDEAARLANSYPDAAAYCVDLRLHPRELIRWREQALAAARRLKNRMMEGVHLGNLGLAYAALGDARRAIELYEQHLVIAREIGDRRGEGADLGNLGNAYAALGDARRAIEFYEQALVIDREIGDRRGEGADLGNLGNAYADLGDARRAIEFYEQRLVIAREIGDRRGEGAALGNLGNAYADLGDARRAIECYEQALVIDREIGDRRGEGSALGNLGNAYADLGDARRAIAFYEQRLVIAREIGDRRGEGNALMNLGNAHYSLGDARRAIEFYEQALVIDREIGDRRGEGNALMGLGIAYYALGDARRAIAFYEQALPIFREIGDRRGEGNALGNLGSAYTDLGDARRAIEFYEQRLVIAREIGDRRGEGNDLWNMALALDTLNRRTEAIPLAESALRLYAQIEDPNAEKVRQTLKEWRG
jgi:tetratricopeptide (TPR) repeat protein